MATPYVYILFILLYSIKQNRYLFLLLCFLLGWGVDFLSYTGGIHTFACLTIGILVLPLLRMVYGKRKFEIDEFRFSDLSGIQWVIYTVILVVIHHFLIFFLESFSFSNIKGILLKTIYCSLFTLIFVYSYLILFRKKAE
ncbi:MAG: rod shape-determining protein MreD [Weeksellaceae bacterium]|nr:rod shape-determining protein MreD [Weeksellaceae bacterium]MDX9705171.1 rod shape-determining protein MreD [Weeksellaceae bacterium]